MRINCASHQLRQNLAASEMAGKHNKIVGGYCELLCCDEVIAGPGNVA